MNPPLPHLPTHTTNNKRPQNIHGAANFGCGVGHSQFIGSGTVVYTNILLARTTMLPAFYGTNGKGTLGIFLSPF